MLRRDPQAVVAAHLMDQSRRELYVEGPRDRLFLNWLLGDDMNAETSVREIALVDLPRRQDGGERGRLLDFGQWLASKDVQIRLFVDADWDRLLSRSVPPAVWMTDHRDLEGYVLRAECVDKVLRLGIATNHGVAKDLLKVVNEQGRRLGILRLVSELDSLSLPFQRTRLRRYLDLRDGRVHLRFNPYLQTLLQNANISLSRFEEVCGRLEVVAEQYAAISDSEIVHGKDAMCLFEVALSSHGLRIGEAARLLWTSFEDSFIEAGSTLDAVLAFLRGNAG